MRRKREQGKEIRSKTHTKRDKTTTNIRTRDREKQKQTQITRSRTHLFDIADEGDGRATLDVMLPTARDDCSRLHHCQVHQLGYDTPARGDLRKGARRGGKWWEEVTVLVEREVEEGVGDYVKGKAKD